MGALDGPSKEGRGHLDRKDRGDRRLDEDWMHRRGDFARARRRHRYGRDLHVRLLRRLDPWRSQFLKDERHQRHAHDALYKNVGKPSRHRNSSRVAPDPRACLRTDDHVGDMAPGALGIILLRSIGRALSIGRLNRGTTRLALNTGVEKIAKVGLYGAALNRLVDRDRESALATWALSVVLEKASQERDRLAGCRRYLPAAIGTSRARLRELSNRPENHVHTHYDPASWFFTHSAGTYVRYHGSRILPLAIRQRRRRQVEKSGVPPPAPLHQILVARVIR